MKNRTEFKFQHGSSRENSNDSTVYEKSDVFKLTDLHFNTLQQESAQNLRFTTNNSKSVVNSGNFIKQRSSSTNSSIQKSEHKL